MKRHLTLMLTAGVLALTAAPLRAQDAADVSAFTATGLDALARLDAIEAHLRATTGENERLRYELEQTRGQLRLLSDEFDSLTARLRDGQTLASSPAPAASTPPVMRAAVTTPSAPAVAKPTPVVSKVPTFAEGRNKLLAGDFDGADSALRAYVDANPTGTDAAEARYWLGEIAYVRGNYTAAASDYVAALKVAPSGVRAPDAMVKLAASLREIGQPQQACATLSEFAKRFPKPVPGLQDRAATERKRASCS